MAGVDLWTLAMVTRYAHLMPGRLREGVERLVVAAPAGQNPAGTDTVSDTAPSSVETIAY